MAGLGPTFGRGAMTNHWIDLKNADVVLVIGGNPAENHPASMLWVNRAREERKARLVVVDPRLTRTGARADLYAPIRSGTDIVFLGGLINHVIQRRLYNEEYVKAYTNALTLVHPQYRGPAELNGVFSGFDPKKRSYNPETWQYQTRTETVTGKPVTLPRMAASLDDPQCVFAHLKRHYARYTPEMVERVCGTPKDLFLKVAETFCATGEPGKAGTILYAMGQTQHTVGPQNVRAMAILQLLLGNVGIPGGGVNALRGESNVQGSTDMALLFHDLPGYLGCPTEAQADFAKFTAKWDTTSFWANGPKFFVNLMKAWWGEAATKENDWAYHYLPKVGGNYSWIPLFEALYTGKIKGLLAMGQNPAVCGPNARFERKALGNLDWLVVMELFETETSAFWHAPGVDPKTIKTEVFLLPAADAMQKAGSIVTSGRLIQWRDRVAAPPGEAREDIWILDRLCRTLKALYKGSTAAKDRPILDLVWDYGDPPEAGRVAREINGFALADVKDKDGKALVEPGKTIPGLAVLAAAADPGTIACGNWLYAGYFHPADDGTGVAMPAAKRRGLKDPGGRGIYPFWGWAWPANRRILYNRCSARPDGRPWNEAMKLIWWDAGQKKWVGYDVPDFPPTKAPETRADPAGTGLAAQSGTDAFLMKADGKGWLFSPKGLTDGPLPEHYEPFESPTKNLLSRVNTNPVAKVWDIGDKNRLGKPEEFPIVLTTYRLTEHHAAGMSRHVPWLSELFFGHFIEMSPDLAAEKGIK
ncbi:MAG: formate dehydrogenase-N subunit alpha, partial [Deltaproteobacteria bacterium]|nr:formate dehydrogenase-N subunit alpha [Deltaproteobacteria bacterium]